MKTTVNQTSSHWFVEKITIYQLFCEIKEYIHLPEDVYL